MKPSRFKYVSRPREKWTEAKSTTGGFDTPIKSQFKVYKVKDGKNMIRILPPTWENPDHYALTIYVNYNIGPDRGTYLSLSKMIGKPDPVAEARERARQAGDEKLAQDLGWRERRLMWVIDRNAEEEGPQLFICPATVDASIVNLCADEDTRELIEIDNPDEGRDVRFYREGQGLKTKYDAAKMRIMPASPLHRDPSIQAEWLGYAIENPVPGCLQYYDYDHIAAAFGGNLTPRDDDAIKPGNGKGKLPPDDEDEEIASKRAGTTQPSDDDDDEVPFDEDKDDEAALSLRARIAASKRVGSRG